MKKTIIAMLALAGVASAADTEAKTYTPLKDAGWTLASARGAVDNNKAKQNATEGTIYTNDPWWKQPYATLNLAESITLQKPTDSITFSFTLSVDTILQSNSMLTLALEGTSGGNAATIVMGYGHQYSATDNTHFKSAVVANNSSDVYLFDTTWTGTVDGFSQYNCTDSNRLGGLVEGDTLFSGSILWDDNEGAYTLTLTQGENSAKYNLGSSYEMTGISIAMDGNSTNEAKDYLAVSNLVITKTTATVPEPATATLSLLALAGLAVRRRRR